MGIILLFLIVAAIIAFSKRHILKKAIGFLPSGKMKPTDEKLIRLSLGELESFSQKDLAWMEDYAMTKEQSTLWNDFLRRVDIALNGF